MQKRRSSRRRPCSICGRWFAPNPRSGDRQKTCGSDECKRKQHTRSCRRWNRKNRQYFKEIYLTKRLEAGSSLRSDRSSVETTPIRQRISLLHISPEVVQDVIRRQPLVIMEYIMRMLFRSFQDVIRVELLEIKEELNRMPLVFNSRRDGKGGS